MHRFHSPHHPPAARPQCSSPRALSEFAPSAAAGTPFTCFTSTKVQILTPEELRASSSSGSSSGGGGGAVHPPPPPPPRCTRRYLTDFCEVLSLLAFLSVAALLQLCCSSVAALLRQGRGAQFTCFTSFTSNKVRILKREDVCEFHAAIFRREPAHAYIGAQFTCVTGTKVRALTDGLLRVRAIYRREPDVVPSTKVHVMTPVQKYKLLTPRARARIHRVLCARRSVYLLS